MHYVPINPMILINGVDGIGTGRSKSIPNYYPLDISMNIRKPLINQVMEEVVPYYRNLRGEIEKQADRGFMENGAVEHLDD